MKTNASGDTLWTRTYGGTRIEEGYSVRQTTDGGYIVAGYTNSFGGARNSDAYLIKTNASGDTLWTRIYGATDYDVAGSVQQTSDGGYIVAGMTYPFWYLGTDLWLIKTNASGDTLWTKIYGGQSGDEGNSVQQTSDGGYIVAGSTASFGAGASDVYLIKTDADGNAGVEEPRGSKQETVGSVKATPNPFTSFARIRGHEAERLDLYDISGKMVGTYQGNRVGEGLSPAEYFIKLDDRHGTSLRIVKVR